MTKHAIADGLVTVFNGLPTFGGYSMTGVWLDEYDTIPPSWGVPGIGKSESVKKLAKRKGVKVKKIKLRKMRKRDVRGYMVPLP